MGLMQKTAIVVPCYNESQRLKVDEFLNYARKNKNIYFIFVDDGSTDNTLDIVKGICSSNPEQIFYVKQKKNRGKAEAVRQGFLKAMESDFKNIGFWDADLSTPLDSINRLCELLDHQKKSIAIGSRVKLLGYKIERHPLRHYLGRLFATCASYVLGLPIYDTQCGAKIFKNNSDLERVFSRPFTVRWIFDVEILARYKLIAIEKGVESLEDSVLEYPLKEWVDIQGSKLKTRDFFLAALELFKIYRLYKKGSHPS